VIVYEAEASIGGGARSAELTLPGFVHDICSAVHPLAIASPFFRSLPLAEHGLEWIQPPAALAHPFDDGTAVVIQRSVEATSAMLGSDAGSYCQLLNPFVAQWEPLVNTLLAPLQLPDHPLLLAIFGWRGLRSAQNLADSWFTRERARALFAGWAAHSMLPLDRWGTAAFGLVLGISGHAVGWPLPRGGAQKITDALAAYLRTLGGEIVTSTRVA
jgi:phytoene dehydrogenase-like protein